MVICRFAPSNTGSLHLGSARTALYSYAYAKKMGGICKLRIEDTDKARSTTESLKDILSGLEWLGLKFDEGPTLQDINNNIYDEKYFQSKHIDIHNKYIENLLRSDKAYIGEGDAVFFRMPQEDMSFSDMILGYVKVPKDQQKDFPIRRANGQILFHSAVVLDDALMGVTHVIRANDHLSNTHKHIQLFKAFGFDVPKFAHMPLLLDDKKEKLSKRRTDQSVLIRDFRKMGIIPETIINMLGLLGWSCPEKKTDFDLDYICKNFDILDCGKANAVYDQKKMFSLNSEKLNKMGLEQFQMRCFDYGLESHKEFMDKVCKKDTWKNSPFDDITKLYHKRSKTLAEPFIRGKFFISDAVEYDLDAVEKYFSNNAGLSQLENFMWFIEGLQQEDWNKQNLFEKLNQFVQTHNIKMNDIAQPIRIACSGGVVTPGLPETLELLGREQVLIRLQKCLEHFCPKTELV